MLVVLVVVLVVLVVLVLVLLGPGMGGALRGFAGRLRWHCHFMQKLEDEPRIETQSFVSAFDGLRVADPTGDRAERRAAWAAGRTGYPLIDACMRSLRTTGWINFRMRAMVMSFASYDLWLPWRESGLELARLFTDLQRDPDSDLIILTGQGRAFCAGGDFDWFDRQIADPTVFRDIAHDAKRIVNSLLDMEKPILCRLNGAAAGLGATIALMCDVIVAADTAVIIDPPRKGCDENFLAQLFAYGPRAVVYVSCDPATQMRDLKSFLAAGYQLTAAQPFDLFPQTRHLECVLTLVKTPAAT